MEVENVHLAQSSKRVPIFAFIIGIDKYQRYNDLEAAVNDANRIEQYLKDVLNVPSSHIISLRDEQATRHAILHGFTALMNDSRFNKDEAAVIIYFAGHGARQEKPREWGEDWVPSGEQQIEVMCPVDMGSVSRTTTGEEEIIPGIPDRTISVLLNRLSIEKGNNIVGLTSSLLPSNRTGLNRSGKGDSLTKSNGRTARQIPNPPPISAHCDRVILMRDTRGAKTAKGFSGKNHESHNLLAACGREQYAWEDTKKHSGYFTSALLDVLKKHGAEELTYTSLMHRLNMPPWQTPHCEGINVHRRLFNKREAGADPSFIVCRRQKRTGPLTLHAGAAQGVTPGSKFGIHATNLKSDLDGNPQLGEGIVDKVEAFESVLTIGTVELHGRICYAKQLTRGLEKISVYCDDKAFLKRVLPDDELDDISVLLVDDPCNADLRLTWKDGRVFFDRKDIMGIDRYLGSRLPASIQLEQLDDPPPKNVHAIKVVIGAALHFNHHLTRTGDDFSNVWMELRELRAVYNADYDIILVPEGANLIEEEPATVYVEDCGHLGLTIHNMTDLTLYPYLFYFDPSDLSILEWYTPAFDSGPGSRTRVDPPLLGRSKFTIGFGGGGAPPWELLLRDGEDVDVGFFKLFLTTVPASCSTIPQESPFEVKDSLSRHGQAAAVLNLPYTHLWGTKLATVIQKRRPTETQSV